MAEQYTYEDVNESEMWLLEGTIGPFIAKLKFPWGKADMENKNNRTYPEKVLTAAVKELNTRIIDSGVPGQSDHPDASSGGITKLRDVSHILTKVWMDGKTAMAEAGILGTQKGKDALLVIKSKVPIGASLRGFGQLGKNGHVKPGLKIKTLDLVVDPSFGKEARIDQSSIIESYIPEPSDEGGSGEEKIESQVNEPGDSDSNKVEDTMDKIETLEGLIKEYPDLTKKLEDSVKTEDQKVIDKAVTEKVDAKMEEVKKTVIKGLEEKINAVNAKIEKVFEIERNHVDALAKIEGFIPEDEGKKEENTEGTTDPKLTKKVESLETKNTELQNTLTKMVTEDKKVKDTAKLQIDLKEALTTELAKADNKPYKLLVEKELIAEDGTISIEAVEDVEEAVKTAKTKVSALLVEAQKAGMIKTGLTEIGKVENADEVKEQQVAKKTETTLFQEAKASGFPGKFNDWKKEHGTKKE